MQAGSDSEQSALAPLTTTSLDLLTRAKGGDVQALDDLLRRFVPRLKNWITGRLPNECRDLCDTGDLVQETLIRVVAALPAFEIRHDAGLQAYFRQAVWNRLREEIRRANRRPPVVELDEALPGDDASPLERAIGAEAIARYEAALQQLDEDERSTVIGRLEFGYSYPELALMLGKRTPDAARKLMERAVPKLAQWMADGK